MASTGRAVGGRDRKKRDKKKRKKKKKKIPGALAGDGARRFRCPCPFSSTANCGPGGIGEGNVGHRVALRVGGVTPVVIRSLFGLAWAVLYPLEKKGRGGGEGKSLDSHYGRPGLGFPSLSRFPGSKADLLTGGGKKETSRLLS